MLAFRRFVVAHAALMTIAHLGGEPGPFAPHAGVELGIVAMLVSASIIAFRRPLLGSRVAALAMGLDCLSRLPSTANHAFLTLFCLILLSIADEDLLARDSLRWTAVILFVWSGLQKALAGTWDRGELLAYSIARTPRFQFLAALVPRAERFRLESIDPNAVGAGPYAFESPLLILVSNGVWILEIVLALLLIPKSTRPFAWPSMLVLVGLIELGAREVYFGGIAAALLLLFSTKPILERALIPILVTYVGYTAWFLV